MEKKEAPTILIVDDEDLVRATIRMLLEEHRPNFQVLEAHSGERALELLAGSAPVHLVISDMRMPSMDGAALLSEVSAKHPSTARILLTGYADVPSAQAAINQGKIFRFLTKPCPADTLLEAVDAALREHARIATEQELLEEALRGNVEAKQKLLALMEELRRSQSRLERSKADLEKLVFAASHDLREPARSANLQVSLLKQLLAENAGEECGRILGSLERVARRMLAGVDALRDLARAGLEARPDTVSLDDVVQRVLLDLEERIEQVGARVEVGSLPAVVGNAELLAVLLRNLIDNALKFRRPGVVPRVALRACPPSPADIEPTELDAPEACTLVVEDNGIGIEPDRLEEVFRPFVHLHSREIYEGAHLGLAVCRRIAERQGGAVRAESALGSWTAIRVTLPLPPAVQTEPRWDSSAPEAPRATDRRSPGRPGS